MVMAVDLSVVDLLPFAPDLQADQAFLVIQGVIARTAAFAPDILSEDFAYSAAAKDLLTVAILRRLRSDGAVTTETIGPYSVTVDKSALVAGLYTDAEMDEWARITRLSSPSVLGTTVPVFAFPDAPSSWPDPPVWRA